MSSFQKGLCPICRGYVQVKSFKRHWNTQHERHERKRTYDEVFNTLKVNISDQDKATTTASIDTFFECKKPFLPSFGRLSPLNLPPSKPNQTKTLIINSVFYAYYYSSKLKNRTLNIF